MQRRLTHNVLWMLAERGTQTVAGLAIAAILARALGVEGFGLFQYAQSLVLIAAAATLVCGAEVVVPRLVAQPETTAQRPLLQHVFILRMAAALLAYLALIFVAFFITDMPLLRITLAILGLSVLLREPFGTVIAWLQSKTDNRPAAIVAMAALLIKFILIAALYAAGVRALPVYAAVLALESLIVAVCLIMVYRRRAQASFNVPATVDHSLLRTLMREGALFWLAMLVMMAARRVDQLMLKPAVSLADLGAYAASMQLLDNLALLATVIVNTLAPLLVYRLTDHARAARRVAQLTGGMASLGFAGSILLAVLAPWVIQFLYGAAFEHAAGLLRMMALSTTLLFADAALTVFAVRMRRPIWIVGKWIAVLLVIVSVDSMLIPQYGVHGAAIGYLCANAVAVLIGLTLLMRVWLRVRKAP